MTFPLFEEYVEEIIKKRTGAIFSPPALLLMDKAASHSVDTAKKVNNMECVLIPGGCTSLVQPLDVSLNKPFKSSMRSQWKEWMDQLEANQEFTKAGKRKRVSTLKNLIHTFPKLSVPGSRYHMSYKRYLDKRDDRTTPNFTQSIYCSLLLSQ